MRNKKRGKEREKRKTGFSKPNLNMIGKTEPKNWYYSYYDYSILCILYILCIILYIIFDSSVSFVWCLFFKCHAFQLAQKSMPKYIEKYIQYTEYIQNIQNTQRIHRIYRIHRIHRIEWILRFMFQLQFIHHTLDFVNPSEMKNY